MKHKLLLALFAFTMPALAETENFDMALAGDFQKDFCSIL